MPAKTFLVICILKTEKRIGLKHCMKATSVHIKNIMELNSSVIIRLEILLWLTGCKNFSAPSRNGPQAGKIMVLGSSDLKSINIGLTVELRMPTTQAKTLGTPAR